MIDYISFDRDVCENMHMETFMSRILAHGDLPVAKEKGR
jgi:hypothetical protein